MQFFPLEITLKLETWSEKVSSQRIGVGAKKKVYLGKYVDDFD
jgi:hypothetical protein